MYLQKKFEKKEPFQIFYNYSIQSEGKNLKIDTEREPLRKLEISNPDLYKEQLSNNKTEFQFKGD